MPGLDSGSIIVKATALWDYGPWVNIKLSYKADKLSLWKSQMTINRKHD